jgi:hypothetical protein
VATTFDGSQVFARSVAETVQAAARSLRIPLKPAWYSTPASGRLSMSSARGPYLVTGIRPVAADATYGGVINRVETGGRIYVADAALFSDGSALQRASQSPNAMRALEAPVPVAPGSSLVVKKPDRTGDAVVFGFHVPDAAASSAILARTGVAWARGLLDSFAPIHVDRAVIITAVEIYNASQNADLRVLVDGVPWTPTPLADPNGLGLYGQAFASSVGKLGNITLPRSAFLVRRNAVVTISAPPMTSIPSASAINVVGVAEP